MQAISFSIRNFVTTPRLIAGAVGVGVISLIVWSVLRKQQSTNEGSEPNVGLGSTPTRVTPINLPSSGSTPTPPPSESDREATPTSVEPIWALLQRMPQIISEVEQKHRAPSTEERQKLTAATSLLKTWETNLRGLKQNLMGIKDQMLGIKENMEFWQCVQIVLIVQRVKMGTNQSGADLFDRAGNPEMAEAITQLLQDPKVQEGIAELTDRPKITESMTQLAQDPTAKKAILRLTSNPETAKAVAKLLKLPKGREAINQLTNYAKMTEAITQLVQDPGVKDVIDLISDPEGMQLIHRILGRTDRLLQDHQELVATADPEKPEFKELLVRAESLLAPEQG